MNRPCSFRRESTRTFSLARTWARYRTSGVAACPMCSRARPAPLGLSVSPAPYAYRFQCAACGWRSAWFETTLAHEVRELELDPITHGTV